METLIYLAKASVLLSIFLCIYKLLLSRESFVQINRFYLVLGLLLSFGLPLITFTNVEITEVEIPLENNIVEPTIAYVEQQIPIATTPKMEAVQQPTFWEEITWYEVVLSMYVLGILFFFGKLIYQSSSLLRLLHKTKKLKKKGICYYETDQKIEAFSFFNIMAYNPNLHDKNELNIIKTHEEIHIKQWHSIDMLLGNLACIFLWFLPFVYSYRASIDENLEFIADAKTAEKTKSVKQYQYTLLNYFSLETNMQYASYFFKQSSLKNRIMMLNKEKSKSVNLYKYSFILPFVIGFIWFFQTETLAKEVYIEVEKANMEATSASTESADETEIEPAMIIQQDSTSTSILDKIEGKINKDATDKSLKELEEFFAEHDQKLKFSRIKRNQKGEITRIKIKLSDAKNGFKKENYISGNEPIKEYVIIRDFKNDSAEITEYIAPEKDAYSLLNEAKVIIVNGNKYEKDSPLAITEVEIEKVEGERLEIKAKELEETDFGKIYQLYEDDDAERVVYVFKNIEGSTKNGSSLMRLEINKPKKKFATQFESAYDKTLNKVVTTSVYVEVMPEVEEKIRKHVRNQKKIKLNGKNLDANQHKGKLVLIETFEFTDETLEINGVIKDFGFGKNETIPPYENKLATVLAIDDNGNIKVENMNKSQSHFNKQSYPLTSRKELIEKIYNSTDYVLIDNKKVSKVDLVDKILTYNNVSFDEDELAFYDAELTENENHNNFSKILLQVFMHNKKMDKKQVLWFKNNKEIELASLDFEAYSVENYDVKDTYMLNKDVAVVDVKYTEKPKQPTYVVNGKIIDSEAFSSLDPNTIASIDVIKTYEKLSDDLKNNPFIKEGDFSGAILISLEGKEQNTLSTGQMNYGKNLSFEDLTSSLYNDDIVTFVNGKVISKNEYEEFNPNEIASISVFDDFEKLPDELKKQISFTKKNDERFVLIELKDEEYYKSHFEIIVQKTKDGYSMQCKQGCAWEELEFNLGKIPQYVNASGVSSVFPENRKTPKKLANFHFKIEESENQLKLTKLEGSIWEELSFSINEDENYQLTQNGVTKK